MLRLTYIAATYLFDRTSPATGPDRRRGERVEDHQDRQINSTITTATVGQVRAI